MKGVQTKLEEMVSHNYKGIMCKICEQRGFGILFRVAQNTKKTNYGCAKCIIQKLEEMIGSESSDENKNIQDLINNLKS